MSNKKKTVNRPRLKPELFRIKQRNEIIDFLIDDMEHQYAALEIIRNLIFQAMSCLRETKYKAKNMVDSL